MRSGLICRRQVLSIEGRERDERRCLNLRSSLASPAAASCVLSEAALQRCISYSERLAGVGMPF